MEVPKRRRRGYRANGNTFIISGLHKKSRPDTTFIGHLACRQVQDWWRTHLDDEGAIISANGNPCPATPIETETGNGQRGATP